MPYTIKDHFALMPNSNGSHSANPRPRLFHYTTLAGYLGIVSQKAIWATNIHYLNDSEEFSYGLRYLTEELASEAGHADPTEKVVLLRAIELVEIYRQGFVYTVSFAEDDDLLSQWRGYSGGGGICLGFVVSDLQKIAARAEFRLIRCIYEQSQKALLAKEFVANWLAAIRVKVVLSDHDVDQSAHELVTRYQQLACAFKDPSFREENEWRLVSKFVPLDHPSVKVRCTATMLVPYFEVSLDLDPKGERGSNIGIDSIVVGPSSQRERNLQAAAIAVRAFREISLSLSEIPYRSL